MTKEEEAPEIDYLRWFHRMADFGPAHGDVVLYLQELFEEQTGEKVPERWRCEGLTHS